MTTFAPHPDAPSHGSDRRLRNRAFQRLTDAVRLPTVTPRNGDSWIV